jgi:hypothetical protein
VAIIWLLTAAAFFPSAADLVNQAGRKADQYQQKVLLNAAMLYVVQHGFHPSDEDDAMILYLREKEGVPTLSTVPESQLPDAGPLSVPKYQGIRIDREQAEAEGGGKENLAKYRFALVERGERPYVDH